MELHNAHYLRYRYIKICQLSDQLQQIKSEIARIVYEKRPNVTHENGLWNWARDDCQELVNLHRDMRIEYKEWFRLEKYQ